EAPHTCTRVTRTAGGACGGARRRDREALGVDAVLQQRPAAVHPELLALDAERVGADDDRIDLPPDATPGATRLRVVTGQAALAGETERDPREPSDDRPDQRRPPLIPVDDV